MTSSLLPPLPKKKGSASESKQTCLICRAQPTLWKGGRHDEGSSYRDARGRR